jgi:glycosyltransferase involved in cell wall biosynthesis
MLLDNPLRSDARVEKEAKALVESGFNVTVLATADAHLPEIELRDGYAIHRKIQHQFTKPFGKEYRSFVGKTVSIICSYDFEILHCHDFYMLDLGVYVKQKKTDIRLIYDAHEFLIGWPFYLDNKGWWNKLKGFIVWRKLILNEKKGIKAADNMLTITDSIANEFQRRYRLTQKPFVIGNYPKVSKAVQESLDLKQNLAIAPEDYLLIHSGSIYHTDSQLDSLFKIIQRNSQTHLAFVGNRPRFEEIKQCVSQQGLSRIHFINYPKDQRMVIQLLRGADIGILHVRQNWLAHKLGFSNRFVEYVQAGLAVVGTPQEYTRTINQKYPCCIYYSVSDKKSIEHAIIQAINQLDELKKNAQKAQKELNWETEKEKLTSFFHEISE